MAHVWAVLTELSNLYTASADMPYGAAGKELPVNPLTGECGSVGFLAHALQCAAQASGAWPEDKEVHVAALLHDVGWLLPKPDNMKLLTAAGVEWSAETGIARHDLTGSAYLATLGFPARVCKLVAGHVQAKRYLVATDPAYASTLSEGSRHTLRLQGGPMTPEEVAQFDLDLDSSLICELRRWDEGAKVPGKIVPAWEVYTKDMHMLITAQLFKPFGAQMPGGPLSLQSMLPPNATTALGSEGPGYIVIRGWLSKAEQAAVQQYATEFVPALPDEVAYHTYEKRIDSEDVVPSRTECFAHVHDEAGVGAKLLLQRTAEGATSRLAELCSFLRGGEPQVLYKEKVNYKLGGGTGGYLAHQDYYHAFDEHTNARTSLLSDADICVCMLAVDSIDGENGCPEVAPGWHTRGSLVFSSASSSTFEELGMSMTTATRVQEEDLPWTPVHLQPGDVLIYGNLMPHRSAANSSSRDRRALFAIYSSEAKSGASIRQLYYSFEGSNRRAKRSVATQGKANQFFTGKPVLRSS
jgi:predicted HD phosphohydrolase/ectoine hydroxylase-related dioxygenase (phytanoyl-CoA dioxygenase family)